MLRVHASPVAAQVVYYQTVGYGSNEHFVSEAMWAQVSTTPTELPVSIFVRRCGPNPTSIVSLRNLFPKTIKASSLARRYRPVLDGLLVMAPAQKQVAGRLPAPDEGAVVRYHAEQKC